MIKIQILRGGHVLSNNLTEEQMIDKARFYSELIYRHTREHEADEYDKFLYQLLSEYLQLKEKGMKRYFVKHSQNGWEHTCHYVVYCKEECKKTDEYTLVIDNSVKIEFDETFELEKDELFFTKL